VDQEPRRVSARQTQSLRHNCFHELSNTVIMQHSHLQRRDCEGAVISDPQTRKSLPHATAPRSKLSAGSRFQSAWLEREQPFGSARTSHKPRTTNHPPHRSIPMTPKKLDFRIAMAAYVILATLALFTLEGPMLGAVLLLLGAL